MVESIEFLDMKLHIDDPVGAVGVHLVSGIWGTLAVGLLANPEAPAGLEGLLYTGKVELITVQCLGVLGILAWTTVMMLLTFSLIDKIFGLRVSEEEEVKGLDTAEHGLVRAYADFVLEKN